MSDDGSAEVQELPCLRGLPKQGKQAMARRQMVTVAYLPILVAVNRAVILQPRPSPPLLKAKVFLERVAWDWPMFVFEPFNVLIHRAVG